jgi:uncharacterized repeat protein (TIGR03803 family)
MPMLAKMRFTSSRLVCALLGVALVLLLAQPARADVPFVFAYYYGRGWREWATIPVGLVIELLVLRRYFDMPWKRALLADLWMNAASTIAGFLFLPVPFGFIFALLGIYALRGVAEAAGTVVVIALIDAVIEFGVLRWAFTERFTWKRAIALFVGNLASAVVVAASFQQPISMAEFYSSIMREHEGRDPEAGLVFDARGALYGTTQLGGDSGDGTVFKLTPPAGEGAPWAFATLYHFTGGSDGSSPHGRLIFDSSGALYGTTERGGPASADGTVFKLSPAAGKGKRWTFKTLYTFDENEGNSLQGGLTLDGSGAVYGTANLGGVRNCGRQNSGAYGCGTVFKLTPPADKKYSWTLTTLHRFTGGNAGGNPGTDLTFDRSGSLYGTTEQGGVEAKGGYGIVFKLTPSTGAGTPWTETVLHRFMEKNDGFPSSGLIFDSSGALYGTTSWMGQCGMPGEEGKLEGCGTVFKLTPPAGEGAPWTFATLYRFAGGNDGAAPAGGLTFDSSGALYGTTSRGGVRNCGWNPRKELGCGTVFKLTPPAEIKKPWTLTTLHSFVGGNDGGLTVAGVIFDASGALYGTTAQGGASDRGTVFKLTPPAVGGAQWSNTVLHDFQ